MVDRLAVIAAAICVPPDAFGRMDREQKEIIKNKKRVCQEKVNRAEAEGG
jgi:hypothetical protein